MDLLIAAPLSFVVASDADVHWRQIIIRLTLTFSEILLGVVFTFPNNLFTAFAFFPIGDDSVFET